MNTISLTILEEKDIIHKDWLLEKDAVSEKEITEIDVIQKPRYTGIKKVYSRKGKNGVKLDS